MLCCIMKMHFSYNQIHKTVKKLSQDIIASDYKPEIIVAIGTGGFIPARMLKTFIDLPILTVGIKLYGKDNKAAATPQKIQWIDEVEKKLSGKRVLLVDEVDDSRVTLEYCLRELLNHHPQEIAVAVLHNKLKEKRGAYPEDVTRVFFGQELEDQWIAYPWDAQDIDVHEEAARQREQQGS